MRMAEITRACRRITAVTLFLILLAVIVPLRPALAHQLDSPDLGKTKSMAEMQHEIVMLLIKKKDFEKAAAEANKIFEMKWPGDQEPLLLKELLYLSDQFLHEGRAPLGLQLVEKSSRYFKSTASQISVLKEKGYLYKAMGQDDKAIECFRQAQELENRK